MESVQLASKSLTGQHGDVVLVMIQLNSFQVPPTMKTHLWIYNFIKLHFPFFSRLIFFVVANDALVTI